MLPDGIELTGEAMARMHSYVLGMRNIGGDFGFIHGRAPAGLGDAELNWLAQSSDYQRGAEVVEHWQVLGINENLLAVNRLVSTGPGTRGYTHAAIGFLFSYDELQALAADTNLLLEAIAAVVPTFETLHEITLDGGVPSQGSLSFTQDRLHAARHLVRLLLSMDISGETGYPTSAAHPRQQIQSLIDALFLTARRLPARTIVRSIASDGEAGRGSVMRLAAHDESLEVVTLADALGAALTTAHLVPLLCAALPAPRNADDVMRWLGNAWTQWAASQGVDQLLRRDWLMQLLERLANSPEVKSQLGIGVEDVILQTPYAQRHLHLPAIQALADRNLVFEFHMLRQIAEHGLLLGAPAFEKRRYAAKAWKRSWSLFSASGALMDADIRDEVLTAEASELPQDIAGQLDDPDWMDRCITLIAASLQTAAPLANIHFQYVWSILAECCRVEPLRSRMSQLLFYATDDVQLRARVRSVLLLQWDGVSRPSRQWLLEVTKLWVNVFGCLPNDRRESNPRYQQLRRFRIVCAHELRSTLVLDGGYKYVDYARSVRLDIQALGNTA